MTTSLATPVVPRLYRRPTGRLLGGVASGIAEHIGRRPIEVRAVFVLLTIFGGIGIPLYGVYWIVLPLPPGTERRPVRGGWLIPVIATAVGVVATIVLVRTFPLGGLFIPSLLAVFGAALIWRQAGDSQRERWWRISRSSLSDEADERTGRIRLLGGVGLVIVGGIAVLIGTDPSALPAAFVAVIVTVVGFALITGPWWMRLATDLGSERRERIRSQERAEIAAHLHDSVLQTLALIQRNASSPREVSRLARGQERELRALLYDLRAPTGQLAQGLQTVAGEVEDAYAITIDAVVVGDAALDEHLGAVVSAAREALVNAAKHAGVDAVSLYAEVQPSEVVVFVRDRGKGFDVDAVAADRQGIRGSIVGRIERHGGRVTVRSEPGSGTEVEIVQPRGKSERASQARREEAGSPRNRAAISWGPGAERANDERLREENDQS